jgi:uncharacterized protein (UPF0333 family)
MMKKIKGQGALEYLLLIGGAVLIAVIVIALLVGMGGQSRDTAQDQATKAQKALDQPQPATIVGITPVAGCAATGYITMNWQKLGEGGIYTVKVYNYSETALDVNGSTIGFQISGNPTTLRVTLAAGGSCNDTYWAEITTTKNGQSVESTRMKWNW